MTTQQLWICLGEMLDKGLHDKPVGYFDAESGQFIEIDEAIPYPFHEQQHIEVVELR